MLNQLIFILAFITCTFPFVNAGIAGSDLPPNCRKFIDDGNNIERPFFDETERKDACREHANMRMIMQRDAAKVLHWWKGGTEEYWAEWLVKFAKTRPDGGWYSASLSAIDFEKLYKDLKMDKTQFPQNLTVSIEWYRTVIYCLENNLEYFKDLISFCGGDPADITGGMIYYFEPLFPQVVVTSVSQKLSYGFTLFVVILNVFFKQLF